MELQNLNLREYKNKQNTDAKLKKINLFPQQQQGLLPYVPDRSPIGENKVQI